jgi:hypothetical protein
MDDRFQRFVEGLEKKIVVADGRGKDNTGEGARVFL